MNCRTDKTPQWRRESSKHLYCNSCGLHLRKYNTLPVPAKHVVGSSDYQRRRRTSNSVSVTLRPVGQNLFQVLRAGSLSVNNLANQFSELKIGQDCQVKQPSMEEMVGQVVQIVIVKPTQQDQLEHQLEHHSSDSDYSDKSSSL